MKRTELYFKRVYEILNYFCGANTIEADNFVREHLRFDYPCSEWRFQGKLGFGGKYRSRENIVTCYTEDLTPERQQIIDNANRSLLNNAEDFHLRRPKPILYVDMDGVACDFNKAILEFDPFVFDIEDGEERSDRIDEICLKQDPHIFRRLKPIDGAIEAIEKLYPLYDIIFLSTPMWKVPESYMDKRLWIRDHFGDEFNKRLTLTHRKELSIGDFLIDDRLKNGADKFTGRHMHFGTKLFPDWYSILKYFYNF